MEMPREGDYIAIQSYKHNGTLHRNWRDTMVVKTEQNIIIGVKTPKPLDKLILNAVIKSSLFLIANHLYPT